MKWAEVGNDETLTAKAVKHPSLGLTPSSPFVLAPVAQLVERQIETLKTSVRAGSGTFASVAQRTEQWCSKPWVAGSNPARGANLCSSAFWGECRRLRLRAREAEGRGFKSHQRLWRDARVVYWNRLISDRAEQQSVSVGSNPTLST